MKLNRLQFVERTIFSQLEGDHYIPITDASKQLGALTIQLAYALHLIR